MNTNMLSQAGLELLITLEGVRYRSYQDTSGNWTVGVGHLITENDLNLSRVLRIDPAQISPSDLILTDHQINDLLSLDSEDRIKQINSKLTRPVSQRHMDSIASFVYNMGIGNFEKDHTTANRPSLLDTLNSDVSSDDICNVIMQYSTVKGQVLAGRLKRRYIESSIFLLPETLDVPEGLTDAQTHDALDIIMNYKVTYSKEFNSTVV